MRLSAAHEKPLLKISDEHRGLIRSGYGLADRSHFPVAGFGDAGAGGLVLNDSEDGPPRYPGSAAWAKFGQPARKAMAIAVIVAIKKLFTVFPFFSTFP